MKEGIEGVYTLYSMPVDQGDYNLLKSFCEDFDIPNLPLRENCFFSLNAIAGLHEKVPVTSGNGALMNKLELDIQESVSGDGGKVMTIIGESPLLEKMFLENTHKFTRHGLEVIEEEPILSVILSFEIDDKEYDFELLDMKLKEYLGDTLAFTEIHTRYAKLDDLLDIYDGRLPEPE